VTWSPEPRPRLGGHGPRNPAWPPDASQAERARASEADQDEPTKLRARDDPTRSTSSSARWTAGSEYLEDELGYHIGAGKTYPEFVKAVTAFFVEYGFVDLELVGWNSDHLHARWHRLLGIRAYQRLPLNAVLHDGLAAFGKELHLRCKEFNLGQRLVESWEDIVDTSPEPGSERLSLDPERPS